MITSGPSGFCSCLAFWLWYACAAPRTERCGVTPVACALPRAPNTHPFHANKPPFLLRGELQHVVADRVRHRTLGLQRVTNTRTSPSAVARGMQTQQRTCTHEKLSKHCVKLLFTWHGRHSRRCCRPIACCCIAADLAAATPRAAFPYLLLDPIHGSATLQTVPQRLVRVYNWRHNHHNHCSSRSERGSAQWYAVALGAASRARLNPRGDWSTGPQIHRTAELPNHASQDVRTVQVRTRECPFRRVWGAH